jgi:glyoxylate utilization-related uncharacterized protein
MFNRYNGRLSMQAFLPFLTRVIPLTRFRMSRHSLTALAVLAAAILAAPRVGHAQTFKVEKFDIKGEGGTDYVATEAATGRVFVSRANHMMVIEGATGKVLGDIPIAPKEAGPIYYCWARI